MEFSDGIYISANSFFGKPEQQMAKIKISVQDVILYISL